MTSSIYVLAIHPWPGKVIRSFRCNLKQQRQCQLYPSRSSNKSSPRAHKRSDSTATAEAKLKPGSQLPQFSELSSSPDLPALGWSVASPLRTLLLVQLSLSRFLSIAFAIDVSQVTASLPLPLHLSFVLLHTVSLPVPLSTLVCLPC